MIKYICFVTQRFKIVIARAEVEQRPTGWKVVSRSNRTPCSPYVPLYVPQAFDTYAEAEQFAATEFKSVQKRVIKKLDEDLSRLQKRRDSIESSTLKIRKMYLVK